MIFKVLLPLILAFIMFSLGMGLFNQLILLPLIAFAIVIVFKPVPAAVYRIVMYLVCAIHDLAPAPLAGWKRVT